MARVVIEYNTVGWKLLEPALMHFVCSSAGPGRAQTTTPEDLSDREELLDALPFKFANGLRFYALDQAELLRGAIFQPAIWSPRWGILQSQVTANAVLALTDRQVIIVEEERTFLRKGAQRGWVITHIPLPAVRGLQMAAQPPWQVITIGLGRDGEVAERKMTLEDNAAHAWSELWSKNIMMRIDLQDSSRTY